MVTQALKLAGTKLESFEVLQNEIKAFIGESIDMPTLKQLSHSRRFDLITAIIDLGGSCKVADKMGLTFKSADERRAQNGSQFHAESGKASASLN